MYNNKHHQFNEQYNHKLFAHINRWSDDAINYVATLRPKVVKFLDPNFDNVARVRELVPEALLIYRQWQPHQPLGNSEVGAYAFGQALGRKIAAERIIQAGLVDLVEGYNEVIGQDAPPGEHKRYNKFHIGFKDGLGDAPVRPIAFNFGTGNMDADLILTHYRDVLDQYQWLGFHEYDWPTMDRLHNQGLAEGNGGMWLALRYRRIMAPVIEALGNNWSVIITECGMTQGVLGGQDVGFAYPDNTVGGEWASQTTPISPEDYWQTLQWYNSELMKDDYVAGACLFVTGGQSPWESFETLGVITPKIKEYQQIINEDDGGSMSDIYVNDVRANDDNSLNLVPRIETFEKLKQVFGLDIDSRFGGDAVSPGQHYWKVVGFEVRTGIAAFLTQVKGIDGNPADKILVFNNWPDAPGLPSPATPPYFNNARAGFTDANGVQGAPYGGGAVTGPNGGAYNIWPSTDPTGGLRVGADCVVRVGWIGGTDHLTANAIFQEVIKGGVPLPPPDGTGTAELRLYDKFGGYVGRVILDKGTGDGRRIVLFENGVPVGHAPLVD